MHGDLRRLNQLALEMAGGLEEPGSQIPTAGEILINSSYYRLYQVELIQIFSRTLCLPEHWQVSGARALFWEEFSRTQCN